MLHEQQSADHVTNIDKLHTPQHSHVPVLPQAADMLCCRRLRFGEGLQPQGHAVGAKMDSPDSALRQRLLIP